MIANFSALDENLSDDSDNIILENTQNDAIKSKIPKHRRNKPKIYWPDQALSVMIQSIRENKFVWDAKHHNYQRNDLKHKLFAELANDLSSEHSLDITGGTLLCF